MKATRPTSRQPLAVIMLAVGITSVFGGAHAQSADQAKNRMIETLQAADTNKDGMLTQSELSASLEDGFRRMDRNGDGQVTASDAPRLGRDKYLSRVMPIVKERDVNGDGSLAYSEFSKRPLDNFSAGDADGDGQVELSALIKAIKAQGRP